MSRRRSRRWPSWTRGWRSFIKPSPTSPGWNPCGRSCNRMPITPNRSGSNSRFAARRSTTGSPNSARSSRASPTRSSTTAPVPAEIAADLEELAAETGVGLDELALGRQLGQRHKKLDDAVHKTQQSAVRAMSHYRQNWPVSSADWGDDTEYLADYLARLRSLEDDGLPAFENRFFDLLQRQARNNISQLALVIKGARRDVRIRVDEVNRSLLMTEFAPASFLQIEVRDRTLPQVEEFLASLAKITSGSLAGHA